MGAVGEHLKSLILRQVRDYGLVVWFDPEGYYREFVDELSLPETAVEVFGESFFELRHRVEPYLSAEKDAPPRLVVYVPMSLKDTRDALVELTAPGVVMEPGGNSINRNTRPVVVARQALQRKLGAAWNQDLEKRIEAGQLSLADLERLGERQSSILSLIFGTAHPPEVALKFLGDSSLDGQIASREATGDLAALLSGEFGDGSSDLTANGDTTCEALREAFARHLLLTDFVVSIPEPAPSRFASAKIATGDEANACATLVHQWRNRGDLRKSYADHASRVESGLNLSNLTDELSLRQLRGCRTFAGVETALQTAVEGRILESSAPAAEGVGEILDDRLDGFWARWPERYPDVLPRWLLIKAASELLASASAVEAGVRQSSGGGPGELLERYAGDLSAGDAWCGLDAHHRNLERRNLDYFRPVHEDRSTLENVVALARRRYREAGETLSEAFLGALKDANFDVSAIPRQSETYASRVAPALKSGGKVAYLLVDSLRYEMARDLARQMEGDYEIELSAALATVPTITEIGMAALMPGAESGLEIERVSKGRIGLKIAGEVLTSRGSRVEHLRRRAGASTVVHDVKLEDLLQPSRGTKQKVKAADLVFATSQEIDEQGELGGAAARRFMDEILRWLPRAIRTLADLGCETVIVAADHGYLFADELDSDTRIDPPGGQTADLHRRVWMGVGGTEEPSFLRFPLSRMGYGGGLDIAVPWGFGAFKSPGGSAAYFHGGMSLQEMAIPVLSVKSNTSFGAAHDTDVDWNLRLNSKGITTRFVTVLVEGTPKSLLDTVLPRVRVEVRMGGKAVSEIVSATYDLSESTSDIGLRLVDGKVETNTVALMIDPDEHPESRSGTASVHLLDSTTGVEFDLVEGVETDISV